MLDEALPPDSMRRNLAELCWLRLVLIICMSITALYCHFHGMNLLSAGFALAWIFLLLIVMTLLTALRLQSLTDTDSDEIFLQIMIDLVLLTALFHLTGASSNPFVTYYLVPLAIAASTLSLRQTLALGAMTLLAYSTLFWFDSVGMNSNWPWQSYQGHLLGMWINFIISSSVLVLFLSRMQRRLKAQQGFMNALQRRQLQRDQAVAMGNLAATAVHELATPLSTLMLLADELEQVLPTGDVAQRAVQSLQSELRRCRQILTNLRTQARSPESLPAKPLQAHIDNCLQPLQTQYVERVINCVILTGAEEVVSFPWLLQQVLHNALKNALEAAHSQVKLTLHYANARLHCRIEDDGPGFPADILLLTDAPVPSTKPDGLGLGLFLAQVTLSELGGHLSLRNRKHGGAELIFECPLMAAAVQM